MSNKAHRVGSDRHLGQKPEPPIFDYVDVVALLVFAQLLGLVGIAALIKWMTGAA